MLSKLKKVFGSNTSKNQQTAKVLVTEPSSKLGRAGSETLNNNDEKEAAAKDDLLTNNGDTLEAHPAVFSHADDGIAPSQGFPEWSLPLWRFTRFYDRPDEGPTCLELWPIERLATEFANTGILSHVWGKTESTLIEGVEVLLRTDDPTKVNLFREIIKSGQNGGPRLWVDVLDIDQKNVAVKLAQIEQLPSLYKSKEYTIVYHSERLGGDMFRAKAKWDVPLLVLRDMINNSEHSSRVWTLQEVTLANKLIHVFRTNDPTMVLVTHEEFKASYLYEMFKCLQSGNHIDFIDYYNPSIIRENDMNPFLWAFVKVLSAKSSADSRKGDKLKQQTRFASVIHDHLNGRAAIHNIPPIAYNASNKDLIVKLLEIEAIHLYGDFLLDQTGSKAVFPTEPKEFDYLLSRFLTKDHKRSITGAVHKGFGSSFFRTCEFPILPLPCLGFNHDSLHYTICETSNGTAFKLTEKVRIIVPDENLLRQMYLGLAEVDWWKPENEEQRLFVFEGQLCGFTSTCSYECIPWQKSPFVVPYLAIVPYQGKSAVYHVKRITESDVVFGVPAGNIELENLQLDYITSFERDLVVYLDLEASKTPETLPYQQPQRDPKTSNFKMHDFVNIRASIHGFKSIPDDAPIKDAFARLIEFGIMHLSGDFPVDPIQNVRHVLPNTPLEYKLFLSQVLRCFSFRDATTSFGGFLLAKICLPLVTSKNSQFVETSEGWALWLRVKVVQTNDIFDKIENIYFGTSSPVKKWGQASLPEDINTLFLRNTRQEKEMEQDEREIMLFGLGNEQYYPLPWKYSTIQIPKFLAIFEGTVYMIKFMNNRCVSLGHPAGNIDLSDLLTVTVMEKD
ncbi:hypothetical protein HDU99_007051, partial [Rhizoclosmatium hyalinum]